MRVAIYFSTKNKMISGEEDKEFLGDDKEFLIIYSKEKLKTEHFDFFIYGHRHLPMILELDASTSINNAKAKYINLGDWISYFTFGVFDGNDFELKTFEN